MSSSSSIIHPITTLQAIPALSCRQPPATAPHRWTCRAWCWRGWSSRRCCWLTRAQVGICWCSWLGACGRPAGALQLGAGGLQSMAACTRYNLACSLTLHCCLPLQPFMRTPLRRQTLPRFTTRPSRGGTRCAGCRCRADSLLAEGGPRANRLLAEGCRCGRPGVGRPVHLPALQELLAQPPGLQVPTPSPPPRLQLVPLTQLLLEPPADVVYAKEPAKPCPQGVCVLAGVAGPPGGRVARSWELATHEPLACHACSSCASCGQLLSFSVACLLLFCHSETAP